MARRARFAKIAWQQQAGRMASSVPENSCNRSDQMGPFSLDQKEEFERIALVYREVLLRVACRILRCESLAEDAVQETLLCAWRAFHKFERGTNCRAWLFRIMLNSIRRNRRRVVPLAELPPWQNLDTLMTGRSSFECSAHLDATAAMDALPETQRTIFLLAAVEGFTCKEISAMQAIPIGTVMSRLSRSRAELRKVLRPQIRAGERTE
jgi:RNA polymerase sigma-70 factor, ECF subfamily